jgi:hypothetical protein
VWNIDNLMGWGGSLTPDLAPESLQMGQLARSYAPVGPVWVQHDRQICLDGTPCVPKSFTAFSQHGLLDGGATLGSTTIGLRIEVLFHSVRGSTCRRIPRPGRGHSGEARGSGRESDREVCGDAIVVRS